MKEKDTLSVTEKMCSLVLRTKDQLLMQVQVCIATIILNLEQEPLPPHPKFIKRKTEVLLEQQRLAKARRSGFIQTEHTAPNGMYWTMFTRIGNRIPISNTKDNNDGPTAS